MCLKNYIKTHTIIQIGITLPQYECTETIFINPIELIFKIQEIRTNYYISEIRWWERLQINHGSKIGYGGPRDPRDPEKYYFSETDITRQFTKLTSAVELVNYLEQIQKEYYDHDLYPAFDIIRI